MRTRISNIIGMSLFLLFLVLGLSVQAAKAEPPAAAGTGKDMPGYGYHHRPTENARPRDPTLLEKYQVQPIIESYGWNAKPVDEIKDFLPEPLYNIVKHPEIWGPVRINITPYIPYGPVAKLFLEETKKNKGIAKLDEKGNLLNYKAGAPFPEPKNGLELLHNMRNKLYSDDLQEGPGPAIMTDRAGRVRVGSISVVDTLHFQGRLVSKPKPDYVPNPTKLREVIAWSNREPYDVRGIVQVNYGYQDVNKTDDGWLYLPTLRRVRRMSTKQKQDKIPGGNDLLFLMLNGFTDDVALYDFKLVGRKELLVPHNSKVRTSWIKGKYFQNPDDYYQKINTYVLKIIPKSKRHVFSHWYVYIDPETFVQYYLVTYDRKGRLYLFEDFFCADTVEGVLAYYAVNVVDLQRIHSTIMCFPVQYRNRGRDFEWYDIIRLKDRALGR